MMIIIRIWPKGELNESWNKILNNLEVISNERCSPLYLSQRGEKSFMTLVYDVKDMDSLGDIIVESIPSVLQPEKTRTITLLKPVFFPAPKGRPANLERYQVEISARSEEVENVFNRIIHLDYPKDAFPTYTAYSFGEVDILTSMLSTGKARLLRFVVENLEPLEGVVTVEIGHIDRSQRVAPAEMWKKYRESRYAFKPRAEDEEFDFLESVTARKQELETSSFW
jgi:hypothetical protein